MISSKQPLEVQLSELELLLSEADKRIRSFKNLEKGSLRVTESHGFPQYHFRKENAKEEQYIPTYEKEKISRLAQREYDEKIYKHLQSMQGKLSRFLKGYDVASIDHIYNRMCKGRKKLVIPIKPTDEMLINKWMEIHKGGENTFGEASEFKTLRGEYVRSKSEKILADYFFNNHIPYQYEPRFETDDYRNVYPDFALFNVAKRKTIYWEHLGLVSENDYATKNFRKLMTYEKSGLILGNNLIVSLETLEQPLDIKIIEQKVSLYLM